MYNACLTWERPPQIVRLPRSFPLSRLSGATPAMAATCLRFNLPSSGRFAGKCNRVHPSNAGNAFKQVVFFAPNGAFTDGIGQVAIDPGQLPFKPFHVDFKSYARI